MLEPWGSALDLWPNFFTIAERRKVEWMEPRTRRRCHTRYSKWMNSVCVGLGSSSPPLQCFSSPTLYFWKYPEQDTSPQANSHSDDLNEILTEHLCAFFFFFFPPWGQLRETSNPHISLLNDATKALLTPGPTGCRTAAT